MSLRDHGDREICLRPQGSRALLHSMSLDPGIDL